jgi:uncharacterized membrane protein
MKLLLNRAFVLSLLVSAANGESPSSSTAQQQQDTVLAIECEDFDFVVEIGEQQAWLFLPEFSGSIPQVSSASGNKYEGNNITFWMKGQDAILNYGKQSYEGCRNNPQRAVWEAAKLRGVGFMAKGNEPGWSLEITDNTLVLVSDYGNKQYQIDNAERQTNVQARTTVYRGTDGETEISVKLEARACSDTMADSSYETTVTVQLGEQTLRGCGSALH